MKMKTEIPTAGELMNRNVQSVTPELSLLELIDFFQKHHVTCVPVINSRNANKQLIGFVSEGDALDLLTNELFYQFPEPPSVSNCMKKHPVTITDEVDLFVIASLLVSHGYRHVPVVDSNHQLVGIVSRREVLKAMRSFYVQWKKEHDAEYFPPDLTKIMNHRFIMSSQ